MVNQKLDFLLRKNKGKIKREIYKNMFIESGFKEEDLKDVELQESDRLLTKIRDIFPLINEDTEILVGNRISDSKLLSNVLKERDGQSYCYVFSDDVDICGMYIVKAEKAQKYCLNVAKFGYSRTCFVIDINFNFSATINYDGNLETDIFDIHVKSKQQS
ncbi:hypothetical protein [Pedobacter helvus]|uniref:Uncharacterized protein n=1 Tax=Pedobacter helvus TaxID=2563444 RepID=A0ABW9JCH4_9SPHI|nr:hypothetical protein [Pedobacter ureilyticus]